MLNTISPSVAPVSPKGTPSLGGLREAHCPVALSGPPRGEPPHLHRTQVQVSAVSAPRDAEAQFLNRRRGGQPSNWNAFKHGLYAAKNLSPIQGFSSLKKYAQNMPGKSPVSLIGVVQEYFCLVWELRIKTENLRTALSADKLAHKFFRTLIRLEFARDKQELPLRNLHFVSKYCLGIIRVNIDDIGVSRDADSFRLRLEDGDFTSFAFQESLCASLSDPPYPFITPRQWRVLAPLLPPPDPARRRGRSPIDPRELLDAVFWKLAHHARWQDLPDYYPPMLSCRRYYRRLFLSGRLTTLFSALYQDLVTRGKADLTQFVQNGCFKVTDTTLALGGRDLDDDFNVVFHEFAHQLDLENGEIDGIPRLESKDHYASWTRTLSDALELFRKDVRRRKRTAIDPYAAEDLSEFFAVSVESFFEQPLRLKKTYPALYRELCEYFRQDPAAWFENPR